MRTVFTVLITPLVIAALLLAGCHAGLWFDPDDPESVDLAAGDLRASMAIAADALLTCEEAAPAEAECIASIFEATAIAMRDKDPEVARQVVNRILADLIHEPRTLALYQRLNARIMERVDAHLQAMDLAETDDAARAAANRLIVAALEGVAEGAADYARAPPD